MRKIGFMFALLLGASVSQLVPAAKADMIFDSTNGYCCFEVTLHQVSSTDMKVTVSLTSGAQYFVDTGSANHPGFAANIADLANVTITNLSAPWTMGEVHLSSVVTGGPDFGTFTFFIDNPGPGGSAKNAGPLVFDVTDPNGVSYSSFGKNADGYYFAADIMNAAGFTGEAAAKNNGVCTTDDRNCNNIPNVPEPSSVVLLSTAGIGVLWAMRRRFVRPN
jgi:hypothetical protein